MQYKDFVRKMFEEHRGMPAKDVMRLAAKEWKKINPKAKSKAKGAGLASSIGGLADAIFGFGFDDAKPKRKRATKAKASKSRGGSMNKLAVVPRLEVPFTNNGEIRTLSGGGFLDDFANGFKRGFMAPINLIGDAGSKLSSLVPFLPLLA